MKRLLTTTVEMLLDDPSRRPVILRGARQVGKTWLARELARTTGRTSVEVNFERDVHLARLFTPGDPHRVLEDLGDAFEKTIEPKSSLLFLDEVQAAPNVLPTLRWFAEECPDLPVVAAGSLLEFALGEIDTGLPVGRVSYRHLEPLGFEEFLWAHGQDRLVRRVREWAPGVEMGEALHGKAADWYGRFAMVGGMPAVVAADVEDGDAERCRELQIDLVTTYRDDFAKNAMRMDRTVLDRVLLAVARQLGGKFVYARANDGLKQHQVKRALELLAQARLVTIAPHSAAGGVPLGGEENDRHRKVFLLDVGLLHALMGTPAGTTLPRSSRMGSSVRVRIAEQLAAQQLRALAPDRGGEPKLHYWQRFGGRAAEIGFLVQVGTRIVPVEVKSGAAGSMKSLHQFVHDRGLDLAVRVDTNPPSVQIVDVKTTTGDRVRYRLLSVPGYLLFRLAELVEGLESSP